MNTFQINQSVKKDILITGTVCLLLSFFYCLFFSISTSPLYSHYGYDSIVFQLIGQNWAHGSIPYVELWDHKGPYIFFINCLGYMLTDAKTGVFLLQLIHLAATLLFIYYSFIQVLNSKKVSWLLLCITLVWLGCCYDEGNLTEEYLLPWIAATVFYTIRWTKKRELDKECPIDLRIAIISGIVLAISLMTRLTSAAITCGIFLYAIILTFKDRRYRELSKMLSLFLLGFFAFATPFFLYFYAKGSLAEAWFGTFVANVSHATGYAQLHLPSIIRLFLLSAPFASLIFVSFLLLSKRKKYRPTPILWLFASIPYFIWLLTSQCFTHYAMITVPLIPAFVDSCLKLLESFSPTMRRIPLYIFMFAGIIFFRHSFLHNLNVFDYSFAHDATLLAKNSIPETELNSLCCWECHPAVYMELKTKPCYSHFFAQEWHSSFSEDITQDVLREFSSLKAKWLLVSTHRNGMIREILKNHYSEVASCGINKGNQPLYVLYRLNSQ